MSEPTRRSMLSRATVVAGALAGAGALPEAARAADPAASGGADAPAVVRPGDPRYPDMVVGHNERFVGSPEAVHVVRTAGQVAAVVTEAIRSGKRLSVRSGGHCYADFVYNPQVEVVLDLSTMNRVEYDPRRRAFMIEPGARLGEVYDALYRGWGVTLPGGTCPYVGLGGHATGGGMGVLARRHGLVCDHIEAVEMVVARDGDRARVVTASRESGGDLADLWWACTGGGGGSFGVVTRFWYRSPDATGSDPGRQLPRPPAEVLVGRAVLPWEEQNEETVSRMLRGYGAFFAEHAAADSPYTDLSGMMLLNHRSAGRLYAYGQVDAAAPRAERMMSEYLGALLGDTAGSLPPPQRVTWLDATHLLALFEPSVTLDTTRRNVVKSAYLRGPLTREQCAAVYRSLTREDHANATSSVGFIALGGRSNAVPPDARAYPHRNASSVALFESFWPNPAGDPAVDAAHVAWVREMYAETFSGTGGYPVPGEDYDGCYVNSADLDITDPAHNASGVPWSTLYWGDNYPRLQRVKQRWDPADVFRHAQSVRLP